MNTEHILSDVNCCGGKPCINTLPIANLLTELSKGRLIQEIINEFGLDPTTTLAAFGEFVDYIAKLPIDSKTITTESGRNYLRGNKSRMSKVPVGVVLLDLVNFLTTAEVAEINHLEVEEVKGFLEELSVLMSQNWAGGTPDIAKVISKGWG